MAIPKKTTLKPAPDAASTPVPPKKPIAVTPKKPVAVTPKKPVVVKPKAPVAAKKPVVVKPKAPIAAKKPLVVKPKKPVATTATPAAVALARAAAARATNPASVPAAPVVKHVWSNKDTYADLAFKYYGSIKEPYWRLIYEHNKAIIGEHPNNIKVGLEIEIPPLPDALKKK